MSARDPFGRLLLPACTSCKHAAVERQPGADNLLCREPSVLRVFGRERVAAGLARADVCRAELHRGRK